MCGGFVFGFPIGAKLASDFYKTKLLTEKQTTILSVTANNFSPMYVCGFVLPTLFAKDTVLLKSLVNTTYFLLYFTPLFLATILLLLDANTLSIYNLKYQLLHKQCKKENFLAQHAQKTHQRNANNTFQINMSLLDHSIINGFETLIKLCGYIILFSIFAKITMLIFPAPSLSLQIVLENLEITNGVQLLTYFSHHFTLITTKNSLLFPFFLIK